MGRGVRSHDKVERVPKWSREQVNIKIHKIVILLVIFRRLYFLFSF